VRAEAAAATAALDEARTGLQSERDRRADAEMRLTWAEARLDDKTARIAELDHLAEQRAGELDEARALAAERETELMAEIEELRTQPEAEPAAVAEPAGEPAPEPADEKLEADLAAARSELDRVRAANAHIAARLRHAEQALAEKIPPQRRAPAVTATMGARLIALDMAMKGTPRDETARYLRESFSLEDSGELLDQVYAS
jgi:chromosome segregation ATPase